MSHAERIVTILLENAPTIRGEYWIIDGDVSFADGDVGDVNHEGYAIDHARRLVLDLFAATSDDEYIDEDALKDAVIAWHQDEGIPIEPHNWFAAAKDALLRGTVDEAEAKADIAALECAVGHGDARVTAMQYWGWKWVRKANISTWSFTDSDRRSIIRGLEEIISQEYDEDTDWDALEITIGVGSSGLRHDMTLGELKSGRTPSQDPTWGKMRHNNESQEDPLLTDMGDHVAEISTNRKMQPGEEVSRGTLHAKDLVRRTLEKLKEIHYDGWKEFLEREGGLIAAMDDAKMSAARPDEPPLEDFLWDILTQRMNDKYVPFGCYFGSSEGSAADIGCWPSYDYLKEPGTEEIITTLDSEGFQAQAFLKGMYDPITKYVLLENPNGSMAMYTADGELTWRY